VTSGLYEKTPPQTLVFAALGVIIIQVCYWLDQLWFSTLRLDHNPLLGHLILFLSRLNFIVSGTDREAYLYRNGVEVGRTPVGGLERLSGSYVYSALATVDASGRRDWISTVSSGGRAPNLKDLAHRVAIAPDFFANARALITPGVTLVLTDAPVNPRTRSARGFNILTD
jgi:hypothetical protein